MLGLQWPQLFSLIVTKCKKLKKMHLEAYTKKKSFFFFSVADRCLSFEYAIGNYALKYSITELNVYVEGTGKSKIRVKTVRTTYYSWKSEMVSIKAIYNLVVINTSNMVSYFEVTMYILELFLSRHIDCKKKKMVVISYLTDWHRRRHKLSENWS